MLCDPGPGMFDGIALDRCVACDRGFLDRLDRGPWLGRGARRDRRGVAGGRGRWDRRG